MTATLTQARDEMLAQFKTAWDAGPPSAGLYVQYDDVESDPPTSTDVAWARVTLRHNPVQVGQVTIGNAGGKRRFTRDGLITVQLFTPTGQGLSLADSLAIIVRGAFEGKATSPGNVIFRTVSVNEIGKEARGWHQTNVTVEFEYDEIV